VLRAVVRLQQCFVCLLARHFVFFRDLCQAASEQIFFLIMKKITL
jgi:hypothetical protein